MTTQNKTLEQLIKEAIEELADFPCQMFGGAAHYDKALVVAHFKRHIRLACEAMAGAVEIEEAPTNEPGSLFTPDNYHRQGWNAARAEVQRRSKDFLGKV
jgi:hypothetical protein